MSTQVVTHEPEGVRIIALLTVVTERTRKVIGAKALYRFAESRAARDASPEAIVEEAEASMRLADAQDRALDALIQLAAGLGLVRTLTGKEESPDRRNGQGSTNDDTT